MITEIGQATGSAIGLADGGSNILFTESNGDVVVNLEANAALLTKDVSGNVIGRVDSNSRQVRVVKVALVAAAGGGGVLGWVNPEAGAIIVERIILDVTTQTAGACTLDVGMTATSIATSADNLIDGVSLAAAGLFDNIADIGTNGKPRQKVAAGKWITGTVASGAVTGLVGYAYIHYYNA